MAITGEDFVRMTKTDRELARIFYPEPIICGVCNTEMSPLELREQEEDEENNYSLNGMPAHKDCFYDYDDGTNPSTGIPRMHRGQGDFSYNN